MWSIKRAEGASGEVECATIGCMGGRVVNFLCIFGMPYNLGTCVFFGLGTKYCKAGRCSGLVVA